MLRTVPRDRIEGLDDSVTGLSGAMVSERAARFGSNLILETPPRRWTDLLRDTLRDPMLWFLLGTSALFAIIGQRTEAFVLMAALVPILGMDAYLHRRTHATTEGLRSRLASDAAVFREGSLRRLPATALVPGDLVIIAAGESFPADGILVGGDGVQADESALTGESFPVHKSPLAAIPTDAAEFRVDSRSWGFAGTRMLTGEARMRVVYVGAETIYGEIARSAVDKGETRTPLQRAVGDLVRVLVVGAALLCLTLAIARLRQGFGVVDAMISALTLAVAVLPEEFPVVLTFFLGVGVYRLARRQALVRRAVVVENIGRVSCICSDKTGTMTEGRLRLAHHVIAEGTTAVQMLQLAAAASRREGGDPLDEAILDAVETPMTATRLATFPFTEDRKRETSILRAPDGRIAVVKGAPEVVLRQCTLAGEAMRAWLQRVDEYAAGGHKVIACASRALPGAAEMVGEEPVEGFQFAGLLCFEDPLRPGVRAALETCRQAGIRVIMVTGDHPLTAGAVARDIGLGGERPLVIDGTELGSRLERGDTSILAEVDVIARAVPGQKLALVQALKARGETVVVTGDGVNDVPALQAADIGIAMGERGTRSAREVASIVLLDDDFGSIVGAIAEGRQLFTNLQSSFLYLLMIHLPLVLTAAFIPLAGYPLLYLPVHVVWLELIIHPTALLVFQELPPGGRLMRVRRAKRVRFFDGRQWLSMALVAALVTTVVVVGFVGPVAEGFAVEHARSVALIALALASAGITIGLTGLKTTAARVVVAATILLSAVLVQTPWISALLHLQPLHATDWLLAVAGGALACLFASLPSWSRRPGRDERRLSAT